MSKHLFNQTNGSSRCLYFVRYERSMTVVGVNTTALMMLMRFVNCLAYTARFTRTPVHPSNISVFHRILALYRGQPWVVSFVVVLFIAELAVNA